MEGNDLAEFAPLQQGVIFEGVLANPPEGLKSWRTRIAQRTGDWKTVINAMTPSELPLKSLADSVNRRGIGTIVYTFMPPDAIDAIERWLIRKGISTPVESYTDIEALADDLRYNRSVRVIYVPTQEEQAVIGIRATVLGSERAW